MANHVQAQTHVWNKSPIPLHLKKGIERRIDTASAANLLLPVDIAKNFSVTYLNRSIYMTALTDQPATVRAIVKQNNGSTYLMDIQVGNSILADEPLVIVEADDVSPQQHASPSSSVPITYANLIRYAAIHVYGALENLPIIPNISLVKNTNASIDVVRDSRIETTHIKQWVVRTPKGSRYLSIVKLRNKSLSKMPIEVHKTLFARYLSATIFPTILYQAGASQYRDIAHAFIISALPLQESLK